MLVDSSVPIPTRSGSLHNTDFMSWSMARWNVGLMPSGKRFGSGNQFPTPLPQSWEKLSGNPLGMAYHPASTHQCV